MALPVVAIVGRPNVGKSSLFNALVGRRASIVDPMAGVTRDRVSAVCEIDNVYFELVDTGGHGIVDRDDLDEHVERQIAVAIDRAELILFLVDVREGLTPLDQAMADLLRRHHQVERVRLIANKVDEPHMEAGIGEFVRLGVGPPIPVSALAGYGKSELRDVINRALLNRTEVVPRDPAMKVAIVGKRNAGKSTFVNALAGEERVIVSEIPGTTRDSVDVRIDTEGRSVIVIDTAGVRKRRQIADDVEFFANSRVIQSIRRADVALFMIDAATPISQVDKKLAHLIMGEYKPCVLVINKWDLAKGRASTSDFEDYLERALPEMRHAPIAFTSARMGRNIYSALDVAGSLVKQSRQHVPTARVNAALRQAVAANAPARKRRGPAPKLFYATQVSTQPPTLVIFGSAPRLIGKDYERYLVNRFRETLPFPEIPIRLVFRARKRSAVY